MLELLKKAAAQNDYWTEIRYHKRQLLTLEVRNGILKKSEHKTLAGVGVRCLVDGCWGFVATSDVSALGLQKAVLEASKAAAEAGKMRKQKIKGLAKGQAATGEYSSIKGKVDKVPLATKIKAIIETEKLVSSAGDDIVSSIVNYAEYRDQKYIVSSNGACADYYDQKCDISVVAVAAKDGKQEMAHASNGMTGTWEDLFAEITLKDLATKALRVSRQKLAAEYAQGGQYTVILDPALVGVLAHEAIGHTVEADFVQSGSIVADKIGQKVASPLITLIDDGDMGNAAGTVLVDDEGIKGQRSVIIDQGILTNYLHNQESAEIFGAKPLGNARAFTYRDEPMIRMTNTCILSGQDKLEDMIKGVEEGFLLLEMGQGGQADATAEFMFSVQEGYWIKNGKIEHPVKGITISGQAFEVLESVDAVSEDFKFGMGRGYCGKFQLAKVDGGGPYLRCKVRVGGQQQ